MKKKIGLVLEGGAMRGMWTCGVLDSFLDNNVNVDGIIGTSAGGLFGVNYVSKQRERGIRYNKKYCKDYRYMSIFSLLLTGNIINKKFAFYKVSTKLDPFDNEEFKKSKIDFFVTATNVETGNAEYFKITDPFKDMEKLRATSAIPLVSRCVKVDGNKYLDGGVSDSIPIQKMEEMGYDKIIVVLTQPLDFKKKMISEKKQKLVKFLYKRYPNLIKTMFNRHNDYNETIDYIKQQEKNGKVFVIRPSKKLDIGVVERNPDKLDEIYKIGLKDGEKYIKKLKLFIEK